MKRQPRNSCIVLIDLEEWPPDTAAVGALVRTIKEKGARVIGLDFVIDSRTTLNAPESLAVPLREAGNVVLASDLEGGTTDPLLPDLAQTSFAGFANVLTDWDRRIRRTRLRGADSNGLRVNSFAAVLTEQYAANRAASGGEASTIRTNALPDTVIVNFGGLEENVVIPARLFDSVAQTWQADFCRDKAFIIGTTHSTDIHRIPLWGERSRVSGLEVQGCVLDNLLGAGGSPRSQLGVLS